MNANLQAPQVFDQDAESPMKVARVGRPPRVNAQAIIDAAIEIGLDGVTLKQVADKLGVAVATLYRHVSNRDELVRLAAFRVALRRRLPEPDTGFSVHWAEVAVGYAESLFDSFSREPQLFYELIKGRLGPDVEVDFLEQFLAALAPHGFTAAESIQLHHAIAMLAIGAAAGAMAVVSASADGKPLQTKMRQAFIERDEQELPHLRAALDDYLHINPDGWRLALRGMLLGIAQERNETLPAKFAKP